MRIALVFLAAALAWTPAPTQAAPGTKPNIIFILADDLGIGDLGFNGQNARAASGLPAIATPNIDALASQGTVFTRMYSGAPICSPSRASLLTGFEMNHVIKEHTDMHAEQLRPGDQDKTWGQMLQQAGYTTGMFGKWHLGGVDSPQSTLGVHTPHATPPQKGFEVTFGSLNGGYRTPWLWENDGAGGLKLTPVAPDPTWPGPGAPFRYSQDVTAERVVKFVRDYAHQSEPFAAYVAFEAPHDPFDRTPQGAYANMPWPEVQKNYAAMISGLDRNVGEIMAAVNDPNNDGDASDSIAADTMIVVTSDNGPLWTPHVSGFSTEFFDSNGPFRGEKTNTLEGGIRAPFVVRWDGVTAPGSVNSTHVGNLADIYPTLAELAGQDTPFGQDGVSMLSAITGQGPAARQDALVWTSKDQFTGLNQKSWAIQAGDWKLIRRLSNMAYELYHITADPYETTNLANSRPDIRNALHAMAGLEGVFDEPYFETGSTAGGLNVFYTQYKNWSPQPGSTNFNQAVNWAGGTQFNRTGEPESMYWNTGPAINWLATVSNTLDGYRNAFVTADAKVLGLEVKGEAGVMQVSVLSGVRLDAYNGVRVSHQGVLRLVGGTVATAKEIDVRPGGRLVGEGVITGYQQIVAGIPEFAGKRLLEAEVKNSGVVDVSDGAAGAGLLAVSGDFTQSTAGQLQINIFGGGGVPGVDFDKLNVAGAATLQGTLQVLVNDPFTPLPGQLFPIVSAANLSVAGLTLTGPGAQWFTMSVVGGRDLVLSVTGTGPSGDFDGNGVVNGADLAVWRSGVGQSPGAGDANNDGDVDGADFLVWQRQFGRGAAPASTPAPEPASLALLAAAAAALAQVRSQRAPLQRKRFLVE